MRKTIIVLLLLFLVGCDAFKEPSADYRYAVSGSFDSAHVIYTNSSGGNTTIDVDLPWETTITTKDSGVYSVYASGNDGVDESEDITAAVSRDGKRKETTTSIGKYASAYAGDYWDGG